jgi:hypothetical protein
MCAFLLHSRTQYPVPVPAARAGECLLILFPRTDTGTDFIRPYVPPSESRCQTPLV